MPLVLSLKEDDDFWVNDQQIVVTNVENGTRFWVNVAGEERKREITDAKAHEVCPDVFVSAGGIFKYGLVRVVIEAPKSMQILRGDRYRTRQRERRKLDAVP